MYSIWLKKRNIECTVLYFQEQSKFEIKFKIIFQKYKRVIQKKISTNQEWTLKLAFSIIATYYPRLFFTRLSSSISNLSAPFPRRLQNDSSLRHRGNPIARISVSPCHADSRKRTDPGNGGFSKFFRVISPVPHLVSPIRLTSFSRALSVSLDGNAIHVSRLQIHRFLHRVLIDSPLMALAWNHCRMDDCNKENVIKC